MARASKKLIDAFRKCALKISTSQDYQWGHMGSCNCGYLAQELTTLTKTDIHQYAMQGHGDWAEQVGSFCPTSTLPMDLLISELISAGLTLEDLIQLERLADQDILTRAARPLFHNKKQDVAHYFELWADLLEETLIRSAQKISITEPS